MKMQSASVGYVGIPIYLHDSIQIQIQIHDHVILSLSISSSTCHIGLNIGRGIQKYNKSMTPDIPFHCVFISIFVCKRIQLNDFPLIDQTNKAPSMRIRFRKNQFFPKCAI